MAEDKFLMFRNRLAKVHKHLAKQAKKMGVTCYRLYDHDLSEFPFCIEMYEMNIYMAEYKRRHNMNEAEHREWLERSREIVSEITNIQRENIYLKLRQVKPGRSGQYKKASEKKAEFIIEEDARPSARISEEMVNPGISGLKFIVNLSDYLDTGLFLDHRITRKMVLMEAGDKRVVNLFSYTGSFSVYAAAGGAAEVITVDLSKNYLDWASRNMRLNGFTDDSRYKFIQADVLKYLKQASKDYFDLVVLDPPTFSNSKRMDDILDIQRDHSTLINNCLKILKTGGKIYFSTNYRKFEMDKGAIASTSIKDITKQTTPFDFEGRINRVCYLIEK